MEKRLTQSSFGAGTARNRPARVLVSGSVAFDTIMVFDGHFKDHILPDQVHMLNVSFLTPRLKKEFGGCAANIAYNLVGLGGKATVLATVGHDADGYLRRLNQLDIDTSAIIQINDSFTGQAFITTDLADNQIIAFHPGAMSMAHQVSALDAAKSNGGAPSDCIAIIGPNGKEAMEQHAAQCAQSGIPFIFDPGQGLPMFDGAALRQFVEQANAVTVNDYEAKLMVERTGWSEQEIAAQLEALIITRGAEGSDLYTGGDKASIASVPIGQAVDPTGCGDAFRGGLMFGLSKGWTWLQSTQLGSVLGGIKIEHQGPQNHTVDRAHIADRFASTFGNKPW